ncbi:hypothetical protein FM105_09055 [Brevibacterium yomogidense]|uniref:Uncharacterized protein n=1 Tax=Brevibacterium yomogidense TaxID=946573 RepID=A0A1X6XH00_9MICO|nr:hypothetical protein FM105_09055 [Brevibacterium yomogidense]
MVNKSGPSKSSPTGARSNHSARATNTPGSGGSNPAANGGGDVDAVCPIGSTHATSFRPKRCNRMTP